MTTPTAITFSPAILALVTSGRIDGGQLLTALAPAARAAPAGCAFDIYLGMTRNRPGWTIRCRADTQHSLHLLGATKDDGSPEARPVRRSARTAY
jgi:hypothetical protein